MTQELQTVHGLSLGGAARVQIATRTDKSDFTVGVDNRYTSGIQHVGNTSTQLDLGNVSQPGGWAMFENLGNKTVEISPAGNVSFLTIPPEERCGPLRLSSLTLFAAAPASGASGVELAVTVFDKGE